MGSQITPLIALLCLSAAASTQELVREELGNVPTEDELRSTTLQLLLFNPPDKKTDVKTLVSSFDSLAGIKAVAEEWTDEADKEINVVDLRVVLSMAPDEYDKKIQELRHAIAEKFDVARDKVHAHPALGHLVEVEFSDDSDDDDDEEEGEGSESESTDKKLDKKSSNILTVLRQVGKVSTDEENELPPTVTLKVLFRGWNEQHIVKKAAHLVHLAGHAAIAVDRNNEVPTRAWPWNPHPRAWSYKEGGSEVDLHIVLSVDRAGFRRERKRIEKSIATYFGVPTDRIQVGLVGDKEATGSHRAREISRQLSKLATTSAVGSNSSETLAAELVGVAADVASSKEDAPKHDMARVNFFISNLPSIDHHGEGRASQVNTGSLQTMLGAALLLAGVWLLYLVIRSFLDCRDSMRRSVVSPVEVYHISSDRSSDLRVKNQNNVPVLGSPYQHGMKHGMLASYQIFDSQI
jgi:hypothetical protein